MLLPRFLYVGKPLIIFYIYTHTHASMHVHAIILSGYYANACMH